MLLNINKPEGITSFGVVAKIRKLLNIKQVGHAGTLDPIASGVFACFHIKSNKTYSIYPKNKKLQSNNDFGYKNKYF